MCPTRKRLCPPLFGHCARALLLLLAGCAPDEPIACRAQEFAEGVFLEPGSSMYGPQCEDDATMRVDVLLTTDEGVLFGCYCER